MIKINIKIADDCNTLILNKNLIYIINLSNFDNIKHLTLFYKELHRLGIDFLGSYIDFYGPDFLQTERFKEVIFTKKCLRIVLREESNKIIDGRIRALKWDIRNFNDVLLSNKDFIEIPKHKLYSYNGNIRIIEE